MSRTIAVMSHTDRAAKAAYNKRYREAHRDELNAYMREWRQRNLERERARERAYRQRPEVKARKRVQARAMKLKYRYGLSVDAHAELLEAQGGVCASCGRSPDEGRVLQVDHDHGCCAGERTCGNCVRGLLCEKCNWILGYLESDPSRLEAVTRYLDRWTP